MIKKTVLIILPAILCNAGTCFSQDSSRISLTTGFGIIKVQGQLKKVFQSSIAFNSGVEINLKKNWFVLVEAGFNTLKYDQQVKDDNSPYLFQNTNSSLFSFVLNGGRNFYFNGRKWFLSAYLGGGYLNIGEPGISLNNMTNVIMQTAIRKNNVFGKTGSRFAIRTTSKFFQTLYIDGSWWTSPVKVQNEKFRSLSFFIGTRMGIGNN